MARFQASFGGVKLTVELYFDKKPSFHTKLTIVQRGFSDDWSMWTLGLGSGCPHGLMWIVGTRDNLLSHR